MFTHTQTFLIYVFQDIILSCLAFTHTHVHATLLSSSSASPRMCFPHTGGIKMYKKIEFLFATKVFYILDEIFLYYIFVLF